MLDYKIELLKQVPLLKGLPPEQISAIAAAGKKSYFEAGENLITEGEKGETAYLILTGKASFPRVEDGETVLQDLWPGALVGELGMLIETIHPITVTAQERLRALAFGREAFRALLDQQPSLARHLAESLLIRLQGLADELRKVDGTLALIEKAA